MPDADMWMTTADVAKELRVHPSTVRYWIASGALSAMRVGERQWRIRRSDLARVLRSGSVDVEHRIAHADPYEPPTLRPGSRVFDPKRTRA